MNFKHNDFEIDEFENVEFDVKVLEGSEVEEVYWFWYTFKVMNFERSDDDEVDNKDDYGVNDNDIYQIT